MFLKRDCRVPSTLLVDHPILNTDQFFWWNITNFLITITFFLGRRYEFYILCATMGLFGVTYWVRCTSTPLVCIVSNVMWYLGFSIFLTKTLNTGLQSIQIPSCISWRAVKALSLSRRAVDHYTSVKTQKTPSHSFTCHLLAKHMVSLLAVGDMGCQQL